MKTYTIYYNTLPYDVMRCVPESEQVNAESLTSAFAKLREEKGADKIEIYESPARKFYDETL